MKFINNLEQINDTVMYVTKYTRKEIEGKLDSSSNSINTINNNITTINTNITKLTNNINELNELTGNLKLEHVKNTRVSYIIDQRGGISDPDDMVKGNYYNHPTLGLIKIDDGAFTGNSKYDFLTWLKENTHAYVAKQADNGLRLKQLDDTDRTKFADGTSSIDYINGTIENCDVFIKFPCDIYYKCEPAITAEQPTPNEDYVLVTMCNEIPAGENESKWQKWSKNKLIAVYESTAINDKLYSLSGKRPATNISQINCKDKARARGNGFTIVDYQMNCLIALLFYGYYSSLDSQEQCGYGTRTSCDPNYYPKITGITDDLGMTDTDSVTGNGATTPNEDQIKAGIGSDIKSVNFWGIENCWGDISEYIDNLHIMQAKRPASVTTVDVANYLEDYLNAYPSIKLTENGVTRTITKADVAEFDTAQLFIAISDSKANIQRIIKAWVGYNGGSIKKMQFGDHADIAVKELGGGDSTYFCDYCCIVPSAGYVAFRSSSSNNGDGGVCCLYLNNSVDKSNSHYGSRLLFEGTDDTVHIVDDATESL